MEPVLCICRTLMASLVVTGWVLTTTPGVPPPIKDNEVSVSCPCDWSSWVSTAEQVCPSSMAADRAIPHSPNTETRGLAC